MGLRNGQPLNTGVLQRQFSSWVFVGKERYHTTPSSCRGGHHEVQMLQDQYAEQTLLYPRRQATGTEAFDQSPDVLSYVASHVKN